MQEWFSHASVLFGTGDDAQVRCLIGKHGPQLQIEGRGFRFSVYPSHSHDSLINDQAVTLAGELVEQAQLYLAEIERLHAIQCHESECHEQAHTANGAAA